MPKLPIPAVLRGIEAGSFAEDTVARRLPEIARRVIAENSFDEATNQRLRDLAADLPGGLIRPLLDSAAPDWADWQHALQPNLRQSWLEVPLFTAEMVFYRRVLEASGYFSAGSGYGIDPYKAQKQLGLDQAVEALRQALPHGLPNGDDSLRRLLHRCLWANQADLSLWPVKSRGGGKAGGGGKEAHLLVDQSAAVVEQIKALDGGRVDLLLDNFGVELIFDLLLAVALLAFNPRMSVRLVYKPHPCFVSDVIAPDLAEAMRWLRLDAPGWAQAAAARLEQALSSGRLQTATHFFWASPSPAWEMPPNLRADLAGSALIISKGDVNYRRWIGDALWPAATPLAEIIDPPAPLLLLRVLKSDTVAGLAAGQAEAMHLRDPAWQFNGQWGLIQLVTPG